MSARTSYVRFVAVLIAVLLSGYAGDVHPAAEQPAAEQQAAGMAPEAEAYLNELLALMQQRSINRLTIDWDDFRQKVFAKAAGATSIYETRPAIREALRLLADTHSSYVANNGSRIDKGCVYNPLSAVPVTLSDLPATIGYIKVTGFQGAGDQAADFSDRIQQAIKDADSQGATAWLVDLRGNRGGNMGPMLTGLSPILGEGVLGLFLYPTGEQAAWEIRDGVLYNFGRVIMPNQPTYRVQHDVLRVAVLTDAGTNSAGEAVTISFKGRTDARSFGAPTCGNSTGPQYFQLSDGGTLGLSITVMADRTGQAYGGPVVPDEVIEDPARAVERAVEWLMAGH